MGQVIIFTIQLEDRPFHVAMVMAQIKGVEKNIVSILTAEMAAGTISLLTLPSFITLPNFERFHPQTTEIQPIKFGAFSQKRSKKFQHDDVIISDVSVDVRIFFDR